MFEFEDVPEMVEVLALANKLLRKFSRVGLGTGSGVRCQCQRVATATEFVTCKANHTILHT